MMITLNFVYMYTYIILLIFLLTNLIIQLPLSFLFNYSINTYLLLIQKYGVLKNFFYFFIIILTGLPPFSFFILKFNILSFLLIKLHIISIFLIFIVFFLNVLFYIQIFNVKNQKKNIYNLLKLKFLGNWTMTRFASKNHWNYHIFFILNTSVLFLYVLVFNLYLFNDILIFIS